MKFVSPFVFLFSSLKIMNHHQQRRKSIWPCKQPAMGGPARIILSDNSPWTIVRAWACNSVIFFYLCTKNIFSNLDTTHNVHACTNTQLQIQSHTHTHTHTHTLLKVLTEKGWHMRQSGGLPMPFCPFCWSWTSPTGWAVNRQYPQNHHTLRHTQTQMHAHTKLYLDAYYGLPP